MTLFRRFPAALLAASAILFAACGSEPAGPSDPVPTDGEVNDNPLLFQISPDHMYFNTTDGTVPGPQTLATTGLVAIGSMVTFDRFSYGDDGVAPWLRIAPVPTFQREPLAWLNAVWVDAAAYNALPVRDEAYTAIAHANVPAALNTPQHLFVQLCNEPNGCFSLRLGDVKTDEITPASPRWYPWNYDINEPGDYSYRDWHLFVEPGEHVWVQMIGSAYTVCPETGAMGTLSDVMLHAFQTNGTHIGYNDDACGYQSQLEFQNLTASTQEYIIRAGPLCDANCGGPGYDVFGTYTMRVVDVPFYGFALREEMSPAEQLRLTRLKIDALRR